MPDRRPAGRVALLGTFVDALTFRETLHRIASIVESREPTQHVVLNAAKIVAIHKDPRLKSIVEQCSLINADGTSVVWASRLLGRPLPERVTGIDLMRALLEVATNHQWRIYLLGGRPEVMEQVVMRARASLPGVQIVGSRHGYFTEGETASIVRDIAASRADILFVGLPSPRKEFWIHEHLRELGVPLCMGVGGSFDVFAGFVRRAPSWVQRIGLEWLFRLLQEPKRLWKRYLVTNTQFLVLVAQQLWSRRSMDPQR